MPDPLSAFGLALLSTSVERLATGSARRLRKTAKRKRAFADAMVQAKQLTLEAWSDSEQASEVFEVLEGRLDQRRSEELAEKVVALWMFSAAPDVRKFTESCERTLRYAAFRREEPAPSSNLIARVLGEFLGHLRDALLDQDAFPGLLPKEEITVLRQIRDATQGGPHQTEMHYLSQVAAVYGRVDFVGIPDLKEKPHLSVGDIYVRPRVRRYKEKASTLELPDLIPHTESDLGETSEHVDVVEALSSRKRLVVLGDPGAGKTLLLRYITLGCSQSTDPGGESLGTIEESFPLLPIFLSLPEFASQIRQRGVGYSLLDHAYSSAHGHLMASMRPGFFDEALEEGRCVIALDGLDEVLDRGQRGLVRDAVSALVSMFPKNYYIVTSRVVGYSQAALDDRDFAHYVLLEFDRREISEFLEKWYRARESDASLVTMRVEDLVSAIEQDPGVYELARNPLLLTIIALVHRIEANLPHERVVLYEKCVEALVETWEQAKNLLEPRPPSYKHQRRLLERLAFAMHSRSAGPEPTTAIKQGDLEILLTNFLIDDLEAIPSRNRQVAREQANTLIQLASARSGLLVEAGPGEFAFAHLTFQEYLAACDIQNRCIYLGVEGVWEEIQDYLLDPGWREVVLLLLGRTNSYAKVPDLLIGHILEAGNTDRVEPLLHRHLLLAAQVVASGVQLSDQVCGGIVSDLEAIVKAISQQASRSRSIGVRIYSGECDDCLRALSQMQAPGENGALGSLEGLILDKSLSKAVRWRALRSLAWRRTELSQKAVDIIRSVAGDRDEDHLVRFEALEILGRIVGPAQEIVAFVVGIATDTSQDVVSRFRAARSAAALGEKPASARLVSELLSDRNTATIPGVLDNAQNLDLSESALAVLRTIANDPNEDDVARRESARLVGIAGHKTEAREALLEMAHNPEVGHRMRPSMASSLAEIGFEEDARHLLGSMAQDEGLDLNARSLAKEFLQLHGWMSDLPEEFANLMGRAALELLGQAESAKLDLEERVNALHEISSSSEDVDPSPDLIRRLTALAYEEENDVVLRSAAATTICRLGQASGVAQLLAGFYKELPDLYARHTLLTWAITSLTPDDLTDSLVDELMGLADEDVDAREAAYTGLKRLLGGQID